MNLTKEVKDLYSENYTTLKKEIKEDTNTVSYTHLTLPTTGSLCRFLSTSLLPSWLGSFLGTLFFFAISNGIFFLISVSDISLLVYKNAFDF